MRNGILTSNSAGNSGPFPVTVSNYAPWSLTVAASTIDRKFVARMQLGNGQMFTNPTATIFYSDAWKDVMAPIVVSFSSRGPSPISPDILKPDITAPGVDTLAGWSPLSPSSVYYDDERSTLFNIISGTSMSCPHASGAAAYVKALHPNWSPAAIKSALMTTAYVMDPRKNEDLEFAYGSGQINPVAARDPGLVFDASETDYINFLCKQGYNTSTLRLVTGDNMTNVGAANSTYKASLYMPALISVTVEPSVLTFSAVGETQTFTVNVTGPAISQQPITSGAITWTDGTYVVRTPLVVYNYIPGAPYILDSGESMAPGSTPTFQHSSVYQKIGSIGHRKTHY
ncbi:UNVERIFIED_CONTAM: Cucumisin [Sesamum radiatum]|uniref:Cucumisin n=1 Tax=Sesamum radiatum TaxID=300843 RepID=A0AAW2L2M2_SESRA